jgi:hypothetical protein
VTITFDNTSSAPASFRFAYSRANGDIADAAAAAQGKKLAIVFLNDRGATTTIPNPYGSSPATISAPAQLSAQNTQLVDAVAAANPNTVVVLNTTNPVLTPWLGQVKSVLEMWFSGQEGGTSTARLLLGLADPSGHTDITWPANATDTLWGFDETKKLYPGVKNTGSVAGAAVPQVYLGPPSTAPKSIQFAVRQLVDFDRVSLAAGQSQTVQMTVGLRELQYWKTGGQKWRVAGGQRTIFAGDADSLAQLPLQTTVTIPQKADVTCDDQQLSATLVSGNVTVPTGDWCDLVSDSVAGNVKFTGDALRVTGTTVDGNLTANHATAAADPLSAGTNVVCDSTIEGNLTIKNSSPAAPWNIGLCGPNTIGANLVFSANAARINLLHHNRVQRNLVCSGRQHLTGSADAVKGSTVGRCGL